MLANKTILLLRILLFSGFLILSGVLIAQTGKQLVNNNILSTAKDSLKNGFISKDSTQETKKKHIPRIATKRSAILPGWGQAYNHEYWKIPIVYGALAIPTYTFFYNNSYYKKTKFAYEARYRESLGDSSQVGSIDAQLKGLNLYSLQTYRNSFRKDRDYSILWFFILWGINVADATVFAHLKDFDVSNDLSLHIQPTINSMTSLPGINLVMNFKTPNHRMSSITK